ncbi:RHS repeat-associated core domain-containing protein [Niallia taxi]|uniref:RHS repeat-associated core domain-containing protein n=1 Tax=Niallia taxi TaxID=2499688 RepID=UPI003D26D472
MTIQNHQVKEIKFDGPRGLSAASSTITSSFAPNDELAGLEDYYTVETHTMGNATASVNVTTGNVNLSFNDHSLYARGVLDFDFSRYYNSKSSQTSALGKGWTFDGNEYFVKKSAASSDFYYFDEDGTRHEFVYNSSTGAYNSPKGKYLQLKDATVNNKAGFILTDNDGFSKYFEADPTEANKYRLSYYQDKNNNRIAFRYSNNLLSEIAEVDANNNVIRNSIKFSYNDTKLISESTYNNRSIKYTYDEENRLIGSSLVAKNSNRNPINNSFEYNEDGLLIAYTDGKNNVNTLSYETNLLEVLTPQGDGKESVLTTYEYDKNSNKYLVSDTEGETTTYNRDTANNTFAISTVINPDNTSSKTTYDDNYNVLTETDELGKTETSKFDRNGNVISSTDKEGKTTTYKYDDKNQLIEQIDPDGVKTSNQYTGYNLISSQVGEEITKYEYDKYGRETKEVNPNNTFTNTTYDDANNITKITDAKGNTTSATYNNYGEIISETDAENRTTTYTLDELYPDVKTSVTDGNGNKTLYTYDANGNMLSLTDANGNKKTYKYDGNDQLIESVLPYKGTETITETNTYDENGNLQKIRHNSGITENYEYDEVYQVTSQTIKNSNGKNTIQIANTYDKAGQLTKLVYTDAITNTVKLEKNYSYTTNNLVEKYILGKYSTNYVYDEMDQLISQSTDYDDSTQALHVNKSLTYTDEGKIKSIKTDAGTNNTLKIGYTYDLKNNKAAISLEDGLIETGYTYDSSNNLSSIIYSKGSATALSFQYSYDKTGHIIKESNRSGEIQYVYDSNDQLIKELLPNNINYEYQYDKVGNRTKLIQNGKETSYEYQKGNQIAKKNSIPFNYDLDGNLVQDDKYNYTYNEMGNQSSVKSLDNKTVAQYEYDEEGLRTKKIIGSKTYEYYYDGEDDNLALEVTKDNNQIIRYRYYQWDDAGKVLGMIIKEKNSSGIWDSNNYYFLTNQRGDVISIIDSKGNEVGAYTYDSYGNILSETGVIAKDNNVRYASYYYDSETKHYYLKARYYDPLNGNFLSIDPEPGEEDDPISQNGYTYVGNNPTMKVDPDGHYWAYAIGALGGAAFGVGKYYVQNKLRGKKSTARGALYAAGNGAVKGLMWTGAGRALGFISKMAFGVRVIKTKKVVKHVKQSYRHYKRLVKNPKKHLSNTPAKRLTGIKKARKTSVKKRNKLISTSNAIKKR